MSRIINCWPAVLAALVLVTPAVRGQSSVHWSSYQLVDGLPEAAFDALSFNAAGRLLATRQNAAEACELDGFTVTDFPAPAAALGRMAESPGGQRWALASEGLLELKRNGWEFHPVPEIRDACRSGRISAGQTPNIYPVRQGLILFRVPNGLYEFLIDNVEQPRMIPIRLANPSGLGRFTGMAIAPDDSLWISATHGLARVAGPLRSLEPQTSWTEFPVPDALGLTDFMQPMPDDNGGVTLVAESSATGQKVAAIFDGQRWTTLPAGNHKLGFVWRGPDRALWAATASSLFEWESAQTNWVRHDEIPSTRIADVAVEPGGAFWLATGDGLFRGARPLWSKPEPVDHLETPVTGLARDGRGGVWFLAGGELHHLSGGLHQKYSLPTVSHEPRADHESSSASFPSAESAGIQHPALNVSASSPEPLGSEPVRTDQEVSQAAQPFPKILDFNGGVLVDDGESVFQCESADGQFAPLAAVPGRLLGLLPDGGACFYCGDGPVAFQEFDGRSFHRIPNWPDLGTHGTAGEMGSSNDAAEVQDDHARAFSGKSLLHWGELLNAMLVTRQGDVWLAGGRSILWQHAETWERFAGGEPGVPEDIVALAEEPDGKICAAVPEGLWEFDGKHWAALPGRFNHINALMEENNGELWLASNGGLFRYCNGVWVENGEPEGVPNGAVYALAEDGAGQIWAGGAHGLAMFQRGPASPPRTTVNWLGARSHSLSEGDTLNLLFDGEAKWKTTPKERMLYSWKLDQGTWSDFRASPVFSLPIPAAGRHVFEVRSMDRNGNVDPTPATANFAVVTPWFRETRLWMVLLPGLAAAVFFAGVALNRHRRLIRSYAAVEQKVAERTRELELATQELLHSQKMNALGTLAAGIAHDFNNILSIIKGSAQIIEDNPDQPEKIRVRVNRIKTVVQQGAEIVDAMLGFGRTTDATATVCDVNAVVASTLKLLGDRFLREVEVKFDRAEELPTVSAVPQFVQQILLNFIFNAAEAMTNRKKITLITRNVPGLPPEIVLPPPAAGAFVLISVQDRGIGIAPEIKGRIFEPFFTTKAMSSRRGTGLGLSMVYELAKKMGAGLAVSSVLGQGSTFTLILPVRASVAQPRPADAAEPLNA